MTKNQKYHNFVPCIFGAHNFSVLSRARSGQYTTVTQECENCHHEQIKTLWHVQYEGTPVERLHKTKTPKSFAKPRLPVAHA